MQLAEVQLQNPVDESEVPAWMPLAENCAGGAEEEKVEDSDKISAAEISYLQKVIRRGLLDSHQDLKVQRKDPNSPLFCEKLPIPQFVS